MDYSEIKKLDEESLKNMTEGIGPSDQCLCSLLSPPKEQKGGFRASIKKALGLEGIRGKRFSGSSGQNVVDIPLSFITGGKGIKTTKEAVKRKNSCGKCGCDDSNVVLNHSVASIRIVSPDISSFCPCPSDCIDKEKLANNIHVTVEHCQVMDTDIESFKLNHNLDQDLDQKDHKQESESKLTQQRSMPSVTDEIYDDFEYESMASSTLSEDLENLNHE